MVQSYKDAPVMRIHLWLETNEGMFFGTGRTLLLEKIDEYGSLKRAAEDLGMSYRAAWGKIRKTEEVIGFRLIEKTGSNNKSGYKLTESGKILLNQFKRWFDEVEKYALKKASEILPCQIVGFNETQRKRKPPGEKT
jgi:molybdate transport system regulatory protein